MSKVVTRKEVIAERDQLAGQIEQLKVDHAEQVSALETVNAELTAKVSELTEANEGLTSDLAAATEARDVAITERDEAVTRAAKAEDELTRAKKALSDPAFVDAALVGTEIDQAKEDAEADAAEKKFAEEPAKKFEDMTLAEQYESMPAGPERKAFWDKNKNMIMKELAAR